MLPAAIQRDIERWTLSVYVTDALRAISENTSVSASYFTDGKSGKLMARRWADLNKPELPEETRTPEEVTEYMLSLLREGR